jgi:nitrite reductase/ring-hydroxylating ferredoxin subunit
VLASPRTASAVLACHIRACAAHSLVGCHLSQKQRPGDKFVWVTFAQVSDLRPGEIISGFNYGQELAIINTKQGGLFAMSNKLPPTSQPATLCTITDDGQSLIEPIGGTSFSLKTGKVVGDWCPSFLGKLIFGRLMGPSDVPVFKVRKQGGTVQALININLKAQFEFNYWRGVLDSQGKVDGGYY